MKKYLFLLPVAAVALTACTNESNEFVGKPEAREINFSPLTAPTTRAAVDGITFPTTLGMQVAAYDATAGANFFGATTFSYNSTATKWAGGKYWPLTPATINFLAYADLEGSAVWNTTNPASSVVLTMTDNKTAQKDLMYACGTGTVSQTSNALDFPTDVPMEFKHAQAWIKFTVKAGDATSASAITVNSITLNSVSCNGKFTVTHTNWNETKAARDADASKNGSVSGAWTDYGSGSSIPAVAATGYTALSTTEQDYASLMVVPDQGIASFTINYTVDGNTYNYTYTPTSTSLAQATKYVYNITMTLNEILIAPTVANWANGGSVNVSI